ncbi:hypothetical protein D1B31_04560 [Neobacillus notoginsengisoli]|uniref:Uncharacterized protein n=1 Tax=Neobacillus notoginsengisoli TaxID=1578198 RepID=A0A417YZ32_9BACI|nr:hypothetical protein D1B31_04560 [Neobacillus notoginsengisoli]
MSNEAVEPSLCFPLLPFASPGDSAKNRKDCGVGGSLGELLKRAGRKVFLLRGGVGVFGGG